MIHDTIQDIIILMDSLKYTIYHDKGNRSGRDCMVVEWTTRAVSAYHR
jgi:hypothetical protein